MPKSLSGYLDDGRGHPLSGISTIATRLSDGAFIDTTVTDADGYWAFAGLPTADEYLVTLTDGSGNAVARAPWSGELREAWVRDRLDVAGKPVVLDPAAGNALAWTATGLYVPPAPTPLDGYTKAESDGRYVNVAGDTMTGSLHITNASAAVELGTPGTANTPFIDFHSSANTHDFDVRLIASGGTASPGQGVLQVASAFLDPMGTIRMQTGKKIDFAEDIADDKLDLYGGVYTIGIRGATLGYFTALNAAHRFYSNNVERLSIDGNGKVVVSPASGSGSSGITLTEPGANDASLSLTSSTAPRTWLVGVEGSRGYNIVGTVGGFFIHDNTAGLSRLRISTVGQVSLWSEGESLVAFRSGGAEPGHPHTGQSGHDCRTDQLSGRGCSPHRHLGGLHQQRLSGHWRHPAHHASGQRGQGAGRLATRPVRRQRDIAKPTAHSRRRHRQHALWPVATGVRYDRPPDRRDHGYAQRPDQPWPDLHGHQRFLLSTLGREPPDHPEHAGHGCHQHPLVGVVGVHRQRLNDRRCHDGIALAGVRTYLLGVEGSRAAIGPYAGFVIYDQQAGTPRLSIRYNNGAVGIGNIAAAGGSAQLDVFSTEAALPTLRVSWHGAMADAFVWTNLTGKYGTVFGVNNVGWVTDTGTAFASVGQTRAVINRVLPVYNTAGGLYGYIRVYDSQS